MTPGVRLAVLDWAGTTIDFGCLAPAGAFVGLIAGMTCVGLAATFTNVAFLWHNVTGAVAVVVIGLLVSLFTRPRQPA